MKTKVPVVNSCCFCQSRLYLFPLITPLWFSGNLPIPIRYQPGGPIKLWIKGLRGGLALLPCPYSYLPRPIREKSQEPGPRTERGWSWVDYNSSRVDYNSSKEVSLLLHPDLCPSCFCLCGALFVLTPHSSTKFHFPVGPFLWLALQCRETLLVIPLYQYLGRLNKSLKTIQQVGDGYCR